MRVLAVTNMYPTAASPWQGTFVERQVESLRGLVDIRVLHIQRVGDGRRAYASVHQSVGEAIGRERPDVVHVMYGGLLAFLTTLSAGDLPVVISFCGSDLLGDPQQSWRRRTAGRLSVWASKAASVRAAAIIAKSRQLASRVPCVVPRNKIHIIPNGIDLEQFKPFDREACWQHLGWTEQEFNILFTGDPSSETKRFSLAADVVEKLKKRSVPARLRVMRGVSHADVPTYLNAADALLLCSIHEGSPNIVKESLACECPVVSTDVGDVAERIEGIAGCYLSSPDPEDMASCLESVFQSGARLSCRGKLGQISLAAVAERVTGVYRTAIKAREIRSTGACRAGLV